MIKQKLFAMIILLMLTGPVSKAGQFSARFEQYLIDHRRETSITAIVTMTDQVDLESLQAELSARHADRQEWHETVVRTLQTKATETQADLISFLENLHTQGLVTGYRSLWVGNVIIVTGTPEALNSIVTRSDVAQISPNDEIKTIEPIIREDSLPSIARVEQGLRAIHADQVWAMGYNGAGRLVCNLDTGVDGYHPAFYSRWRGFDPRYTDNPQWAWCDPETNTQFPFDSDAHGTHTMGIMCGLGESSGDTIGVAIGADWIAAGVIARRGYIEDALFAFQWVADPDGDPATVWDVPDVCSNSWGFDAICDETYWVVIDGCEASGVVVVFAAGNDGPNERTLLSPADRASSELSSFSVGAVDYDNTIARFSSRGPSSCTPDGTDAIKPELTAPGVNIRSSVPGSRYEDNWSGTSMACPHVAGVVALMRQANPNLSSQQVKEILLETADDLGLNGADNSYGNGLVNAYSAVMRALQYIDGWGTIAGTITDMATGAPLAGAKVSIENRAWEAISRGNGQFSIYIPSDTAWTMKIEHKPTHIALYDTVTAFESDTVTQNYVLEGKVGITLMASFGNPANVSYRSFFIKGSWDDDGFYNAGWSGSQIEIKDNGIYPDQVANDGVFTGATLLARDFVHAFQWAIYSEQYGGEASRLQSGTDFQVLTFSSPTIPVLEVNPSGNYNDWIITLTGDHGLNQDLTRGVNGREARWGATITLDSGITYTFNFSVMHSTIAGYGSGGVGGPSLHYTAPASASHQIIFDDSDDSYIIQITGTDGPPKFLTAVSGQEASVPLIWFPPAAIESREMAYDNGDFRHGYGYASYDVYMAEMFAPPIHPLAIDSVMIRVATVGDPDWPWPDPNADPIGVAIFLEGENGQPEDSPVFYQEVQGNEAGWIRVDVDELIVTEGNFWVAMRNIPGGYDEALGLDYVTDYPAHKWARVGNVWGLESHFPGDHMIRAKILTAELLLEIGPGPEPISQVASSIPIFSDSSQQVFISDNLSKEAVPNDNIDFTVYSPRIISDNSPIIFDTEDLLGYNIYRSTAPAPYDRNLKDNADLISVNNYNDRGVGLQGPLSNGITYYYQASAVYDIGGGRHVEVGPSNQAMGTPINLPPAVPAGLVAMVSGDTASLRWNHNDDYDIAAYKVYRCDYNQYDYHVVGIVNVPETTFNEIPPLDGIYRYRISAVDNGGLESAGYSNYVDASIGLIPPRGLRASTGQDSRITLQWRRPGISRQMNVMILATDPNNAEVPISEISLFDDVISAIYYEPSSLDRPTLERLMPYDVILVWGGTDIWDRVGTGNVLADYVESGGAVILSQLCFNEQTFNILEGRIMNQYSPFSRGYHENRVVELGVFNHSHPIMQDVHMLTDFWGSVVNVINGGELVASYIDGVPFLAVHPCQKVVGINGYFGSSCQFTGDMMTVVRNAMGYVCGNWHITPSYFRLYKSESPSGPFNQIAQLPGDSLAYTDAPVPNGIEFYYKLTAVYPGNQESNPTSTVMGCGVIGARAEITPASYDISLPAGLSMDTVLNINNIGGIPMEYQLELDLTDFMPKREAHASENSNSLQTIKKAASGASDDLPITQSSGGPDAYGYTWDDSSEPDGPEYNFIDISDYGFELENLNWDETRGPYGIGYFEFPFYGNVFNSVYIASNGFISFTERARGMFTTPLPDTSGPENLISPFWNEFYPPGGGAVYYYSAEDSFIVMWEDLVDPYNLGPFTFELILQPKGIITFQYLALPAQYIRNTIGIQNHDKNIGLQISYNQHWLSPGTAIKIKPNWLTLEPITAIVDPGQTANLAVHLSAEFLEEGTYSGSIIANTWDIYHRAPQITIPVVFHVLHPNGTDENEPELPQTFALRQNYPNPFNPSTVIQFDLPKACHVSILIYNVLGQQVRALVNSEQQAGYHTVVWDGTDESDSPVSSGTYFYILKAGDQSTSKKMTLMR
jgi:subtilisin family serine protease